MSKLAADLSAVTSLGLDLAKHVFQVRCTAADGTVIVARALRRREVVPYFAALPRCRVGVEACSSAHHRARELIPPAYVKPFVKRQKNDADDTAAIRKALSNYVTSLQLHP